MKYHIKTSRYPVVLFLFWTAVIFISAAFNVYQFWQDGIEDALIEARSSYNADSAYQTWIAHVGGIYASADMVPPNPYLKVPHRDVVTSTGRRLTMINSAYMTRMVAEKAEKTTTPVMKKLTSLKAMHPSHTPDIFEKKALLAFEKGDKWMQEKTTINDLPYLRVIWPVMTERA
ncbi:MAG: DUF3365 domain-containing protein, partial [Syntrophales bacterium]|nr:DUF3365 domain-containing protein [Syntrophales bacterium]